MSQTKDQIALYGLLKTLGLNPARRNDKEILKVLENNEPVDHIQGLNEAGLLDPFFDFMEEAGIFECIKNVNTLSYRRVMIPIVLLLLTYMTKILIGIPSMNALPEPPKPFSPQMLANFVERLSAEEVETFFNNVIHALARFGVFPKKITAILDGSDLETTEKYKGCGRAKRTKKIKGKEVKVEVFGFKIIAIMDLYTQIPLAVKVTKINERESDYTIKLLKQAIKNVEGYAEITHLVFDRGFIDGQDFYAIDQLGIIFIIPAKTNMSVYHDARSIAAAGSGGFCFQID